METVDTERLLLRSWRPDDIDALAAIFAEPAMWWYPFARGFTREESERFLVRQIEHWDEHGFGVWAAELADTQELIGFIGLAVPEWLPAVIPAVEVGFRLHPSFWGKGLATEGGRASLRHGFEALRLERIISIFMPENAASGRVTVKLGMHDCLTTTHPERGFTLEVREITRNEWRPDTAGTHC